MLYLFGFAFATSIGKWLVCKDFECKGCAGASRCGAVLSANTLTQRSWLVRRAGLENSLTMTEEVEETKVRALPVTVDGLFSASCLVPAVSAFPLP